MKKGAALSIGFFMQNITLKREAVIPEINQPRLKVGFKHAHRILADQAKTSECLLLISVGQEAHEGTLFELTIKLINASFGKCTVLLGDSIQRYTMALASNSEPESYYQAALKAGDDWLQRNSNALSKLTLPYKLVRWDDWLFHPNFANTKETIVVALEEDEQYRKAFMETVDGYLNRYKRQRSFIGHFDWRRSSRICLNYLIEECAIFCLWPELKCEFEIYPNAHNLAIEATRRKFLVPAFPDLLRSVNLRFRHANLFGPLQFTSLQ